MALGGALGLAWAPVTPLVSRGRRGTHGTGWRAWTGLGACDAAALCVAGVAQPDIHLRFTWQAWHNLTSTVVLRGRRATYGTGWRPWAGIWRRGAAPHFAWQAWHNLTSTFVSRGRRGTNSHLLSFCVAGEPLMVLGGALGPGFGAGAPRHFAWQAWHNLTSTFVSRGRHGTISHLPSFCVAGVPLMVLGGALGPGFGAGAPRHFAWQAWHNLTSTFVSRGRRGTHGTGWRAWTGLGTCDAAALCVAGVAQPDIHLRFTWQAWHKLTSTFVSRGRRATDGTGWRPWAGIWRRGAAPLCVAGVAQSDIHLRFTWQAWHNLTSTVVLRGRRATYGTGWRPWAGIWRRGAAPHFAWQAWHNLKSTFVSRGRRGKT